MKKLAAVILACFYAPFALAQHSDTSCSPANQKALEDTYHRAVLDSNFLPSLEDGNIRWLNVTVKFCKLDLVTALQAGKPAQPDQIIALLNYDSLGEMVLTEKMRRSCSAGALPSRSGSQEPSRNNAGSTLRIVNAQLVKVPDHSWGIDFPNCLYAVKGSIYNPNNDGAKNVVISYYIWKKYMGEGAPSVNPRTGSKLPVMWRSNGGVVTATINYLPPKQTVDFVATSGNAGVMTPESGLVPDPISAEISAEWDRQ
jgi:hypothetical protein